MCVCVREEGEEGEREERERGGERERERAKEQFLPLN